MGIQIKKIRLTPEAEVEMVPAKSLGYFGGEIPFILVRLDNSQVVKVFLGQVIPVGQMCRIINPFQRTIDVQIVLNSPPVFTNSFKGIDNSDPRAIRYYTSARFSNANNLSRGVMVYQNVGSSYVNIQYATNVNVEVVRNFGPEALAAQPANLLALDGQALHADGSVNNRVTIKNGYFSTGDMNAFLKYDGRADWPVIASRVATGWEGVLEAGTALLLRRNANVAMEYSITIIDCGVDTYDE